MNKALYCLFLFAFAFSSCKTPASAVKTPPASLPNPNTVRPAIVDSMRFHAVHYDWISAKAKIEIIEGTDKTEFTANFRIRQDSAIWISISPALGLEAARVLMTKDSIRVIDRLNKRYHGENYSFFKKYTSLDVSFETIQNLVEGNPIFEEEKQFNVSSNDSAYFLSWGDSVTTNSITLNRQFMNIMQEIHDGSSGSVKTSTQQYDPQYNPPFPLWRKIEVRHPSETQIVITFSKVKVNEPMKLPFNVKEQ